MQEINNEPEAPTLDTTLNLNGLNATFDALINEANELKAQMDSAKTRLKRDYYAKKLAKIKKKVMRTLLAKSIENPQLLKKQAEAASE